MIDKLAGEEQRYEELMRLLGTSEVQSDPSEFRKHAKALAELEPLVQRFREYKAVVHDLAGAEELAASGDADMRDMAKEEMRSLIARRDALSWLARPRLPLCTHHVVLDPPSRERSVT